MSHQSRSDIGQHEYFTQSLTKLNIDQLKDHDIKFIFEVLSIQAQNRTISDLDTLTKIFLHIEPIKKINNLSAIYFLSQRMILQKYKSKQIIFDDFHAHSAVTSGVTSGVVSGDSSPHHSKNYIRSTGGGANSKQQSLYIVLNGKVALYRKSIQYFDHDQVIFLGPGCCFGALYDWKIKFIPISVQGTLLAVAPRAQFNKIPMHLSYERQLMLKQLRNSDIFLNSQASIEQLQQMSKQLTLIKVPCGNFLIRQGETPKALFYVLRGIVKKIIIIGKAKPNMLLNSSKNLQEVINGNSKQKLDQDKIIQVKRFSQGQYCPRNLKGTFRFELIAQTPCQLIVIPKKVLRQLKNPTIQAPQPHPITIHSTINQKLQKKAEWQKYKSNYISKMSGNQYRQKIRQKSKEREKNMGKSMSGFKKCALWR